MSAVGLVDRLRMRTERAFVDWARERSIPTGRILRHAGEMDPRRHGASVRFSGDELSGELTLVATPELLAPASGTVHMRPSDEIALAAAEVFDRLAAAMQRLGVELRLEGVRAVSPVAMEEAIFDLTFAAGGGVVVLSVTADVLEATPPPRRSTTRPRVQSSTKTTRRTSVR